jgi:2-iminoacetate synthase ThiH
MKISSKEMNFHLQSIKNMEVDEISNPKHIKVEEILKKLPDFEK